MTAQTISIFNSLTLPNIENKSIVFERGIGFYLIVPTATVEYEIDIFLQVQLTPTVTRMVRLEPLNISNTERLTLIPQQLRDLGLPMYLAIFPSEAFNLEILLLKHECDFCEELEAVSQKIDELTAQLEELTNNNGNLETILQLILNALGIPVPVTPTSMNTTDFEPLFILGVI